MRRQRGFWNVVAMLFWVALSILTALDLALRFWKWHFAPAVYNLDARGNARRRRIILMEILTLVVLGLVAWAFAKFGPLRPIHEWRD